MSHLIISTSHLDTTDHQPDVPQTQFLKLLPNALPELFAQVSATGQLTQADRYGLLAAFLDQAIEPDQHRMIDRIFYGIRRGWIKLVDEFKGDLQ